MRLGKRLLQTLEGKTDLPLSFALGQPRIELEGTGSVRVEQHRGLAAYGPELVVVRGSRLTLESMSVRELRLRGLILALEYRY